MYYDCEVLVVYWRTSHFFFAIKNISFSPKSFFLALELIESFGCTARIVQPTAKRLPTPSAMNSRGRTAVCSLVHKLPSLTRRAFSQWNRGQTYAPCAIHLSCVCADVEVVVQGFRDFSTESDRSSARTSFPDLFFRQ